MHFNVNSLSNVEYYFFLKFFLLHTAFNVCQTWPFNLKLTKGYLTGVACDLHCMYSLNCTLSNDLEKQQLHLFSLIFYLFDADVAVQLPDKKSIIMYLTSLFEVLPKQVTMEDIREVETLPRRYKQECEDGEFNMQQVCLSSKSAWLFLSCNFS